MRYRILSEFNGRTRRFKEGAEVAEGDLADTVFTVTELTAKKMVEPAIAPAPVAERTETKAEVKAAKADSAF